MKNLTKRLAAILISLSIISMPAKAFAASGRVVSGPSGPGANGWFSAQPTFVVDTVPSCSSGPRTFTVGSWGGEGLHHITFRAYDNNHPTIDQLDDHNGTGTNAATWICPDSGPAYSGDPIIFWEGDIKWDGTAPTISISSPSNNTNTDSNSVQVSGSVGDATSGVWKVVINGVGANLSGSGYTASVPVSNGLNTLTAIVYDYAGNTTQAQVIINRIISCGGQCSAQGGSSSTSTPSSNSNSSNQNNNSASNKTDENSLLVNDEAKVENKKVETQTIVKGVVQGSGIGLASILGFIIVLLILDKFRVIEIKAFSAITHRLSKPVVSKDNKKSKKK